MGEEVVEAQEPKLHPQDQMAKDWAQKALMGGRTGKEVVDELTSWGARQRDLTDLRVGSVYEGIDNRIRIGLDHPTAPKLGRDLGIDTLRAVHDLRVEERGKVKIAYPRPRELGRFDPKKSYVFTFSQKQYAELRRKIAPEETKKTLLRRILKR